jgi:hypothetical protein
VQRRAEAVQDGTVKGFCPVVEERVQARVGDAGLFLQPVAGPALPPKHLRQFTANHKASVQMPLVMDSTIYISYSI